MWLFLVNARSEALSSDALKSNICSLPHFLFNLESPPKKKKQ
jgi:hypothetical protein